MVTLENRVVPVESLRNYFTPGRIVPSFGGKDRVVKFNEGEDGRWSVTVQALTQNKSGAWVDAPGASPRSHGTQPTLQAMRAAGVDPGVGALYRVDLKPTDAELLDWDKPLSEQSDGVKAALAAAYQERGMPVGDDGAPLYFGRNPDGDNLYTSLAGSFRGKTDASLKEEASKLLQKHGVRGIKYLDQGSRGKAEGSHNYVIFDGADVAIEEVLAQQADDYSQRIAQTVSGLRDVRGSDQAAKAAKEFIGRPLRNNDAGIAATVSGNSLRKMLTKSSWSKSFSSPAHMQAVANLDKLFPVAILREPPRPDRDAKPEIKQIFHFDTAMPFEGEVVRVKMLVKEFVDPKEGTRLYDVQAVEIEKGEARVIKAAPTSPHEATSSVPNLPAGSQEKFDRLVAEVKSASGSGVQQQRQRDVIRGETHILRGDELVRAVVRLFEAQDESTLLHELAHVLVNRLRKQGGERLAALERAFGVAGGKWTEGRHEHVARAWERYWREGKAPTAALQKAFDDFKQWLTKVYRSIKGSPLDVALTDEMRALFEGTLRAVLREAGVEVDDFLKAWPIRNA